MKLTKKIICIYLSAITLLPGVGALKSSISMPENICHYDYSEEKDAKDSPYELEKTSERIAREVQYTPLDKTIGDTEELCIQTFSKMYNFLCYQEVPSDCFYVAGLSNYEEILQHINYILFKIILEKSDNMKQFFTPSPRTRVNLDASLMTIEAVIERYESIFHVELSQTFMHETQAQKLHRLMLTTWEGMYRVFNLNSFK